MIPMERAQFQPRGSLQRWVRNRSMAAALTAIFALTGCAADTPADIDAARDPATLAPILSPAEVKLRESEQRWREQRGEADWAQQVGADLLRLQRRVNALDSNLTEAQPWHSDDRYDYYEVCSRIGALEPALRQAAASKPANVPSDLAHGLVRASDAAYETLAVCTLAHDGGNQPARLQQLQEQNLELRSATTVAIAVFSNRYGDLDEPEPPK
jgi:hypothetical protein